jgi:flagellar FliL protein
MSAAPEKPAEGTPAAGAPAAGGGGVKALMPLILSVALMPAVAFVMTKFVLIPQLQKGMTVKAATPDEHAAAASEHGAAPSAHGEKPAAHGEKPAGHGEKTKGDAGGKRGSYEMTKILVNVAGTMGARFLQVSISISGTGEGFADKMEERKPQLKDMAMSTLGTKTIADLEKPNARNLIRTELITGFNNILGDSMVQEIYFTDFAIQ